MELSESYLYKDIFSMAQIKKPIVLEKLVQALALQVGWEVNYHELGQTIGADKETVERYIDLLEKAFVIFRLSSFSRNMRNEIKKGRKIYFYDNGIATILAQPGEGALFENAIFNQLKAYGELHYLTHGSLYEVDFILTQPGKAPVGLEAKYHPLPTDQDKLDRIAKRHDLAEAWLVGRYPTPGYDRFIWGGLIF